MHFGADVLIAYFLIAMAAACVDAIAGGGGLITMPALLWIGIPPSVAIATNKLGAMAGSLSAALHFISKGEVKLGSAYRLAISVFVGSLIGAFCLSRIDNAILSKIIPFLLIAFAAYFIMSPNIGQKDKLPKTSITTFGLAIAPCLGFYDGFFGPGAGSLMAASCVVFLGFNLLKATAHAKVLNFSSNLAALLFFLFSGKIYWDIGLAMMGGQLIGGRLGAKLVMKSGQKLIRSIMVGVTLLISIKLLVASRF